MKTRMKNLLPTWLLALSLICAFGCDDDVEISGERTFNGLITVSPSTAKNGDTVTFDIEQERHTGMSINDEKLIFTVSYFVDGKKVAEVSSDGLEPFEATYVVTDFEPGTYRVTAHCETNWENYDIIEEIYSARLTIEE